MAAEDPWDEVLMQRVARRIAQQPVPAAAARSAMQAWLGETASAGAAASQADNQAGMADGPIVQFVDQALLAGFTGGASDVHRRDKPAVCANRSTKADCHRRSSFTCALLGGDCESVQRECHEMREHLICSAKQRCRPSDVVE